MRPIIKVRNLSKRYRIGARQEAFPTLRDSITQTLRAPFDRFRRNGTHDGNTIWALKDVSFEVAPGEVVGIIGRNGAGKSTLLKILSRIVTPTIGQVDLYGRVASLLEVGTGFHVELSGRENIYLNGAILGMKKSEINRKFDEIVAFSEIETFIDTQVKHYSSGMYMRLAFAVAAHLEPEILLVDEVLAVGDAGFQKKCLGKMHEVGREGKTVIFVSHNMAAIQNLCGRVILIGNGQVEYSGGTNDGIDRYMATAKILTSGEMDLAAHPMREKGKIPLLRAIRLLDNNGVSKSRFSPREPMRIELTFDPIVDLDDPQFGIGVDDSLGTRIFSLATYLSDAVLVPLKQPSRVICSIDQLSLAPGRYHLSLSAGTIRNMLMDAIENAVSFEVAADDFFGNGRSIPAGLGKTLVRSRWESSPLN
jgi:lipopolysaccharide transport system ATP-binding protein